MTETAPTRLPTGERQAEIVAAALHLARQTSPPLITTAEIAAAVGVTQGAVFKHFATKQDIWVAAMAWVRVQLLAALEAAAGDSRAPMDALGAVFRAHIGFVVAHPGVPRVIFHELQDPQDTPVKREVRSLLQGYRKLLLHWLGAAAARGELAADVDPQAAATLFVGMVQGLVMQSMAAGRTAAIKAQSEAVLAIFLRGISKA